MKHSRRRILGLPLAVLLLLLSSVSVGAHADLVSSEPADGTTVQPPERVVATFSEELETEGSTLTVLGPDGEQVDTGDSGVDLDNLDRNTLVATLPSDLPAGDYTVEWTTVSAVDDDEESGSFSFTVDPDAVAAASPEASPSLPAVVAPTGTVEPLGNAAGDDDGGIGRGAWIVGLVSVVVALSVVASVGRRRRRL